MKKLIIILFSILISFSSYGEWTEVSKSVDGGTYYIDKIRKHNGYLYWWLLYDLIKPNPYGDMSVKLYQQGDCGVNRYKDYSMIFYIEPMGKGVGIPENILDPEWRYPTPDSNDIGKHSLDFACNSVD
jgi:hypothetical protein